MMTKIPHFVNMAFFQQPVRGSSDEQTTHFNYNLQAPLTERFSLRFGLNYGRLDFGRPTGSPLPDNLQTLGASIGVGYKLSEKRSWFAAVMPRLQLVDGWDHTESNDFQLGGVIGGNYDPNEDFSMMFGVLINPGDFSKLPVLPMLGLRWRFAQPWTLNLGFPRTALDYQLLPQLRLTPLQVNFQGGSFRTSKTYGNSVGMPALNDRKLNYIEMRVGAAAAYSVTKNLDIDLDAGAVAFREFNFKNAGFSPKLDPAPYVQLALQVGF